MCHQKKQKKTFSEKSEKWLVSSTTGLRLFSLPFFFNLYLKTVSYVLHGFILNFLLTTFERNCQDG